MLFDLLFKKKVKQMLSFEISNIHFSLKNSFNNIKKDMSDLIKWSHQQSSTQNQKIRELELKIARLEGAFVVQQKPQKTKEILVQKLPREEQIEEEMDLNPSIQKMYEALPNAYKSLLIRLTTLSKEGASKWVYMKDLTRDLYPTTSYKDVKSMISSYTDKLLDY